jgi:hypothetical protein
MIKSTINEGIINSIKKNSKHIPVAMAGVGALTAAALGADSISKNLEINKINSDRNIETRDMPSDIKNNIHAQKDEEINKVKNKHNWSSFKKVAYGGGTIGSLGLMNRAIKKGKKSNIKLENENEK